MASWWELVATAIGALGGTAVLAGSVAAVVSKFVNDRLVESHKAALAQETERLKAQLVQDGDRLRLGLKKQELLFAKELEAASAYMKVRREIEPKFRFPGMEWPDALDDALGNLSDIGEKLESFVLAHGAVIPTAIKNDILELRDLADSHKFDDAHGAFEGERQYSQEAVAAAEKILSNLRIIEDRLLQDVRSWERQDLR